MAKIKGLLFFVALALIVFIGGLVNAVKVKAQDPAPAYKTAVQFADNEISLTLKAVNDKVIDAYSVKQENKYLKDADNLQISDFKFQISNFKYGRKIHNSKFITQNCKSFSQNENRCQGNLSPGIHTIRNKGACHLRA